MNAFTQPFHKYSSRNKQGHRPVAQSYMVRERVVTMWFQQFTLEEIAASLQISTEACKVYIRKARERGDERANDRRITMRELKARARRRDILKLDKSGMSAREIATFLNVHYKLVQLRLREARKAIGYRT